jgi:hypothetical protein
MKTHTGLKMDHTFKKFFLGIILAVFIPSAFIGPAFSGVVSAQAPLEPKGDTAVGVLIYPVDSPDTRVRLLDAQVHIQFLLLEPDLIPQTLEDAAALNYNTAIQVESRYRLRNTGRQIERLKIGFPVTGSRCDSMQGPKEWLLYSHEMDPATFTVQVDGIRTSNLAGLTTTAYPASDETPPGSCETQQQYFSASFLPGQDVDITIQYQMKAGVSPYLWTQYVYVLDTGEDWFDSIGQIYVRMEMPYPLTRENTGRLPAGAWISGNQLRWRGKQVKSHENIRFELMDAHPWRYLQRCRREASNSPGDTEAWMRLAGLYQQLASGTYLFHVERWQYAHLAVDAYQQVIGLDPESALSRYRLGKMLANMATSAAGSRLRMDHAAVRIALRELELARMINEKTFELDPDGIQQSIDDLKCQASPGCEVPYRGP